MHAHIGITHKQVKRDLDISMNEFLKEETIGKDKAAMFQVR